MKNVTINSANNVSRQFVANDNDTAMSVIAHVDVRNFFGFGDVDAENAVEVLKEHIDGIDNGDDSYDLSTATANFRNAILNAVLANGAEININYYAVEDEDGNPLDLDTDNDDQAAEQAEDTVAAAAPKAAAPTAAPAGEAIHGRITVYTNAGMTETVVEIIDGQTTIQDAIYTDIVQSRSGMDETSISNCMVQLNGDTISPNNLATRKLHAGDTIELTPRFAASKGNRN